MRLQGILGLKSFVLRILGRRTDTGRNRKGQRERGWRGVKERRKGIPKEGERGIKKMGGGLWQGLFHLET